MNNKAIIMSQVMFLILGIVGIIVVVYILIGQGLGGAVAAQTYGVTCTFSAYSRGIFIKSVNGPIDMVQKAFRYTRATYEAAGPTAGAGLLLGGGFANKGLIQGAVSGDKFIVSLLSTIPLMCPTQIADVGEDTRGARASPEEFYTLFGRKILDAYDTFGHGGYDPLIGADPPNPRTYAVIEAHLSEQINLKDAYDFIKEEFTDEATSWFGSAESARIFVYCRDFNSEEYEMQSLGNNPSNFEKCSFDDARIYVMFKDNHEFERYTVGTHLCSPNIAYDAALFSFETSELKKILFFQDEDKNRIELPTESPWYKENDAVVICVEKI